MASDYRTAFPDFPPETMPALPPGFVDQSFRNDVCPCFVNEATGLCIWVDYVEPDQREIPDGKRFMVEQMDFGGDVGWQHVGTDPVMVTDDLQAALDCALGEAFVHFLRKDIGEFLFALTQVRNALDTDHATGSVCHSHDFCDANMDMIAAFQAIYGREPFTPVDAEGGESTQEQADAEMSLMMQAWAYAAKARLTATGPDMDLRRALKVGTRVRLLADLDRYPNFVAKAGSVGTVVSNEEVDLWVLLDAFLPGAEEWDNQVQWRWFDDQHPDDEPHAASRMFEVMEDQTPQPPADAEAVQARIKALAEAEEEAYGDPSRDTFVPPPPGSDAEAIEDALTAACVVLQQHLGQTDGGVAAQFFDGPHMSEFRDLMTRYLAFERAIAAR